MIDGKYELLREVSRQGNVTLSEVRAGAGVTRQVAWFETPTPAARQAFHAYRSALRALTPAGLTDVVARPGAYYSVWQPVAGTPLETALAQPKLDEGLAEALRELAARLEAHGYALDDAQIVVEGQEPRLAYLPPRETPRPPEEVAARNAQTLAALQGRRVRPRRQPGAWLTFAPGLLFLAGALYLGAQAAQIYLNPPMREVSAVSGQEARAAARALTAQGFRVDYTYGQAGNVAIGAVIRQDPPAGTNLPVGRQVLLTVNNPPSIEVPNVQEMTPAQARDALKERTMVLGKVLKVDGTLTNTPEGRVVAQLPEPGSSAQRGQPVQVMVSTGIEGKKTLVPIVIGMTYQQAREFVRAAGLVITRVTEEGSDKEAGTVLEQTPAAYARVPVGSPVTLKVAIARSSVPSRPAGELPLPPVYVPPTPAQPEPVQDPQPPEAVDPGAEPGTGPGTGPTPGSGPEILPTPQPAPSPAPDQRTVRLNYTFPADLPAGTYTLFVRDEQGERQLSFASGNAPDAAALAGQVASAEVGVTGSAVFIIRRDGADFATVNP